MIHFTDRSWYRGYSCDSFCRQVSGIEAIAVIHLTDRSVVRDLSCDLFCRQYSRIENCEQRCRYKQDFNNEYEEYRCLHEKVQNVTRRFQHLKERILNTKEGSQEFEVSSVCVFWDLRISRDSQVKSVP